MAAVAAEPGAAVPTQTRPESPPEPEPFEPAEPRGGPESVPESGAEPGAGGRPRSAERGEGRHVGPEQPGAGPVLPGPNRTAEEPPDRTAAPGLSDPPPTDCGGSDRVQPGLPNPEPQPPAVFLHSVPDPVLDPAPVSEAGLSLAEPAEPTETTEPDRYSVLEQQRSGSERKERSGSEPSSVLDLSPGTEVRVSLEHVIDDALVVSFRRGQREFSGVLMDVSRRFGPYGIPITPFPRRDDGARPSASLQTVAGGDEPSADGEEAAPARPPPCGAKPPPLFQEGAPYPPPLFIRDTYNQALPQPPPRKIKRPKRRYRCEEPTSIMNAIKLRPRQVLCDKCKGVVASAGPREARRGAAERRPADVPMSSELKRLKMDDRSKRSVPAAPASRRVLGGVASPSAPPSGRMRLKLNSKKVLTPGSDRPNARKAAAPERNPDGGKAVTRAAALQKVHFTRLQSPASSAGGTPLPPRMRLKPQRYRTDDPAPCSASESSPAHSPPAPATAPPTPPPPAVAVETSEDRGAPPPSSSSDSSHSETFDPPPSSSSLAPPPAPPPSSAVVSHCPASSPPAPPTADGEEEEDGGGDAKRRRKLSTSSSSSSSSSSSVFSKSVSKCLLPDGRTACVGDIVWAKIYGFPWWPARVLGITVARRGDTGLAVQQEARVSWFGSPTTSFLPLAQLSPFLETFQLRFDKKRKGPYRRAIAEAASAAKQLTPEVRALLTQFET